MATLLGTIKQRFFDLNGAPLAGGKLYSFEAGTSTPLATFTDESGGVANDNPVILDSGGYADVWLGGNQYKFVLYDSEDNLLLSTDNISVLNNGTVTASSLADNAVTTPKIINDAVTTPKIINNAVTTAKVVDGAITAGKLASDAVTTNKIINDAVTTNKVADGAITADKLADGSIASSKLAPVNYALSASSGTFQTNSIAFTLITNLSVSFTATGRPIVAELIADGSNIGLIYGTNTHNSALIMKYGSTTFAGFGIGLSGDVVPAGAIRHTLYGLAAGTYTFTVLGDTSTGGTLTVTGIKLSVREL